MQSRCLQQMSPSAAKATGHSVSTTDYTNATAGKFSECLFEQREPGESGQGRKLSRRSDVTGQQWHQHQQHYRNALSLESVPVGWASSNNSGAAGASSFSASGTDSPSFSDPGKRLVNRFLQSGTTGVDGGGCGGLLPPHNAVGAGASFSAVAGTTASTASSRVSSTDSWGWVPMERSLGRIWLHGLVSRSLGTWVPAGREAAVAVAAEEEPLLLPPVGGSSVRSRSTGNTDGVCNAYAKTVAELLANLASAAKAELTSAVLPREEVVASSEEALSRLHADIGHVHDTLKEMERQVLVERLGPLRREFQDGGGDGGNAVTPRDSFGGRLSELVEGQLGELLKFENGIEELRIALDAQKALLHRLETAVKLRERVNDMRRKAGFSARVKDCEGILYDIAAAFIGVILWWLLRL
ncbi:uncharacterized protein Ecym_5068 [Eremothecium cymbalariae DBVPG|uniref:Uncharacterized protein n=1 Tax=Eremothecium cymbalariae (strain CBS 270.75 / DBVPG 7215 / KCTC 17166 / NRRL Y-17582) TaxID=931890 RepID=I6NCR6_ERECY|nr:hypothetical protein Ecym_5068 [Eremothecium cymbalariae DBVPG\